MLCLLEVARIACNRHSFSPAPGLVEFEQEIDREIEKELKREEEKKKLKELRASALKHVEAAVAAGENGHANGHSNGHLTGQENGHSEIVEKPEFVEPYQNGGGKTIDEALPEVDQGVQLEDLDEEDEVTLHNGRPLSSGSNVDEIDRGSLMDEETSATES